ncbi:MAG: FAD-dependent oxidoreductase [Gammaproteobacteria bacterium]|nr:FAD-dependent oxidoreductase [Gammaproteobacteria bacterium]
MRNLNRRDFIKLVGVSSASSMLALPIRASATAAYRVVIVGGGFGGATCANYLKHFDPAIDVTLVEPKKEFVTCPFSNTVLAGLHDMEFITHNYDRLRDHNKIHVVNDTVIDIDATKKIVILNNGNKLSYDRLVISPGIGFRWGLIKGYDDEASHIMPHAWRAGEQTILLRKQLQAMDDGGVVIIAPPPEPFRAPPAPYERASLIAYYLKKAKPKSKVLIVDSNKTFAKQSLFEAGWKKLYPGMIEWVSGSDVGRIERVDAGSMQLFSSSGQEFKGAVVNLIPPQQANTIAVNTALTDQDGWCPVNQKTFESLKQKDIHVIGDASIVGDMPKTGHAANTQAKICAANIVSDIRGVAIPEMVYSTSIYSLLSKKYAISRASVYRLKDNKIKAVSVKDSPNKASKKTRLQESKYALGWYKSITADAFAKEE